MIPEQTYRKVLQRPGYETVPIDQRPSEFKLDVPDLKTAMQQQLKIQQDPRHSIIRAFGNQHDRQVYNEAYKEYMDNNEVPREGLWNSNLSTNAYALKQNAAHEYAMQKLKEDENPWTYTSSFNPRNPWYDWRDAELKYAGKLGEIGLGTAFFGPALLEHGLVGGLARIGGGYGGSYLGEKIGGFVGNKRDETFGTSWRKPAWEIAGGLFGWGSGYNALGKLANKGALQFVKSTGRYLPEWISSTPAEVSWVNWGDGVELQEPKAITQGLIGIPQRFESVGTRAYQRPMTYRGIVPQAAFASDFSGVENLDPGNFGYGGAKPNFGLRKLWTERRSKQLLSSVAEEEKRNAAALRQYGKNWKDLTYTQQYWLDVNHGKEWDSKLIVPRRTVSEPILFEQAQPPFLEAGTNPSAIASVENVPDYEEMFKQWYAANIKEPNVTVEHIKQFVKSLPDKGNETFKRNFEENIDDLVKEDTYHRALGAGDIIDEFKLMAMPDREPVYVDEQDVLDFYRTDALPRVLRNIEAAGIKLTPEQINAITEIYSKPFEGVNSKIRYTTPGSGGFSRGSNEIGYSNRYRDVDSNGVPTSFIGSGTTVHELHHRLRSKLGEYLKSQGIKLNPDIPADPNNPFSLPHWEPPKSLQNTSSDILVNRVRNRTPQTEYTPQEIQLMEPLAMLREFTADKTPIAEIGAVSAGNARFKAWQLAKQQLPARRTIPTLEETDSFVKSLLDNGVGWYKSLPYGYQIGSLAEKEYNDAYKAIARRDDLYGLLANARYKKLPLYRKIFVKLPERRYGLFSDEYLPDTQTKREELFTKHDRDLREAIRKAIVGIGGFGVPVTIGLNNVPQENK